MIVEKKKKNNKNEQLRRRLMMSSASQAASQQHQATTADLPLTGSSSQAAIIMNSRRQQQPSMMIDNGSESADENDEENIVIDMCDEDDEEEEVTSQQQEALLLSKDDVSTTTNHEENYNNNNNNNEDGANFYTKHPIQQQADYPSLIIHTKVGQNLLSNGSLEIGVGDLVWFDPNQLGYSIPGKVIDVYPDLQLLTVEGYAQPNDIEIGDDLECYNRLLMAADEQLQVYNLTDPFQLSTLKMRHPLTQESGHKDLIQLEELSLESIIWNLKLRYKQDLIYTECGSKILLSVNPFKQLNSIYDLDQANRYDSFDANKLRCLNKFELFHTRSTSVSASADQHQVSNSSKLLRWLLLNNNNKNEQRGVDQDAHIFGLANKALMKLLITGQDQSFVLLGESGSGKTEACKLIIQYLASINKSPTNLMTEQILESIQVLESFGNAKTIHNDNSSRFGKLLEVEFSLMNGFILNAKTIDLNLLDRSRIVGQVEQERNYHVFYELLAGLNSSEKEKYGLQVAEKYFYLNQGNCVELQTKEDSDDFRSLLASMQVLGFNYEEQDTIFRVLASVLHLGNIYFHRKVLAVRSGKLSSSSPSVGLDQTTAPSAGVEGVEVGSDTEVRWISHLLQIQFDSVMRCLTVRTTETHPTAQDKIVTPLNIDQALDTRDAIARTLYNCLFKWLIQRINVMISAGKLTSQEEEEEEEAAQNHRTNDHEYDDERGRQAPYGLCRTSESLCEFQPDKLGRSSTRDSNTLRQSSLAHKPLQAATISILDSFGFENLHENNFEQLCINYSAELLQYHTSRYLLRLEQSDYTKERLKWIPLGINDTNHHLGGQQQQQQHHSNTPSISGNCAAGVVNLLSKKPLGILAILDDECNFPKATDQSFVEKCHHNHTLNENYQRARLAPNCNQEFGVRHFRQQTKLVWYQADGFIEKNRDTLRPDILELLLNSKMSIVVDMLRKLHLKHSGALDMGGSGNGKTLSRTYDGRYVSMKPRATTVAAKFQDTLQNNKVLESINPRVMPAQPLSSVVAASSQLAIKEQEYQQQQQQQSATSSPGGEPWFIICLKPNRSRTPALFDVAYVQDQVIGMNLNEIAQIRQRGYPFKMRLNEFVREYLCLVPSRYLNSMSVKKGQVKRGIRDVCKSIIDYATTSASSRARGKIKSSNNNNKVEFQCGLTKVFLSERLYHQLEQRRLAIHHEAICLLQRTMRMWLARARFSRQREAAIVIQAHVRAHAARREFWRQYMLIVCLQRRWRHQLELKHRRQLEEQRQRRRQQQQSQLREMQKKQQINQFRFRQTNNNNNNQTSGGAYYGAGLEIPDDLAQLYRLQRDWLPIHDLSHLQEIEFSTFELREDIAGKEKLIRQIELDERYALEEFLLQFYTNETPQFGYSRLAITRPFDWLHLVKRRKLALKRGKKQHDLAVRSELISSVKQRFESIKGKSIAIYKLVLRYIDSDNTRIEQESNAISASQKLIKFKLLADYVIYLCIQEPLLRNEIYLQLASLSWQNPKQRSSENCWRFMLNCLSCFGPESRKLTRYLLRYTVDNCYYEKYRQSLLEKLANYLEQLPAADNSSGSIQQADEISRKFPPSLLEYRANSKGIKCLALEASSYDTSLHEGGKPEVAQLESQTTSQELARSVLLQLQGPEQQVSEQNLLGWTIEVVPNQVETQDDLAISCCRLRGDDKILDHFSELELQPELVQLLQNDQRDDNQQQQQQQGSSIYGNNRPDTNNSQQYDHKQLTNNHSDYETIAPVRHQRIMMNRRRLSADESQRIHSVASCNKQQRQHYRVSSDLELSPHSTSNFSQTNRFAALDRHNHMMMMNHSGHYNEAGLGARTRRRHEGHYDEPLYPPAIMQPPMMMTSKNQFNRRSMSMQELQLASSALNGRYFNQQQQQHQAGSSSSNHYACSPNFPTATNNDDTLMRPRRSQTPTCHFSQQHRMSSSAYGSEPYNQGPAFSHPESSSRLFNDPSHQQQHYGRYYSGSLSRDDVVSSNSRRARRSASNTSTPVADLSTGLGQQRIPMAAGGNQYQAGSDYASAATCCSDYERTQPYHEQANLFVRPLPTPSAGGRTGQVGRRGGQSRRQQQQQQQASGFKQQTGRRRPGESHYVASSAMSDTSEAPSLASHVKTVKVPQSNGDLDQYLDDLFNPIGLDDNDLDLGEMSDARSLAPSMRGANGSQLLDNLCDAKKLSKIIRGRDSPEVGAPSDNVDNDDNHSRRQGHLSPTFESLLTSLRHGDGGVRDSPEVGDAQQVTSRIGSIGAHQLGEMNLSQLRELNEKLEHEMISQAANRSSSFAVDSRVLSSQAEAEACGGIPEPPPQPSFEQPPASIIQSSPFEDLYERAKTIRVGKVRWPPEMQQQGELHDGGSATKDDKDNGQPRAQQKQQQQQQQQVEQVQAKDEPTNEIKSSSANESQPSSLMMGSVGKLKISQEMKAKLEQLTNSGTTGSNNNNSDELSPPQQQQLPTAMTNNKQSSTGSGIVSQAKSSLMASSNGDGQVKRLAMQRKHLLESQLLGSQQLQQAEGGGGERESFGGGSKIMAAKQQLAAAAGVALALLDSGSACNSQASSRRQSTALTESKSGLGFASLARDLQADDELGPQSRSAISQRQAFYQLDDSGSLLFESVAGKRNSTVIAEEPASDKEEPAKPDVREQPIEAPALPQQTTVPLSAAISSDNLASGQLMLLQNRREKQPPVSVGQGLTRAMQMSSDLNEAGKCSPIGQASELLYGQSIAKTLAQRQQENLRQETSVVEESRDWIASSPDQQKRHLDKPQLQFTANSNKRSAPVSSQSQANHHKRPRSSSYHQQVAVPKQQQQRKSSSSEAALTYANVDWQLKVRKEVFLPSESYDNPLILQLIFSQILADVSKPQQLLTRLNNKERAAIKSILKENSISMDVVAASESIKIHQIDHMKRDLIKLARSFGLYFTRSYEAQNYALLAEDPYYQRARFDDLWSRRRKLSSMCDGDESATSERDESSESDHQLDDDKCDLGRGQTGGSQMAVKLLNRLRNANNLGLDWIDLVAVHHSGLRLVVAIPASSSSSLSNNNNNNDTPTQQQQQQQRFGYKVLETLKYRDMTDVSLIGERELLVSMRNGRKCWLLHSNQATQLSKLLRRFHSDYNSQVKKVSSPAKQAAATSEVGSKKQQLKQQQQQRKQKQEASKQDALLAADDDHYGDHIEQRQTADRIGKLCTTTHSDDDLADNLRVLPDPLALPDSANGGRPESRRRSSSSSAAAAAPDDETARGNDTTKHDDGLGRKDGGRPNSDKHETNNQRSKARTGLSSAPGGQVIAAGSQRSAPATKRKPKRQGGGQSLWQNSLTRMSNKFTIFGSVGSQSNHTLKGGANKQQTDNVGQQQPQQVTLDAWIEAKVDFDEDENSLDDSLQQQQSLQKRDEATMSVVSSASVSTSTSKQQANDQTSSSRFGVTNDNNNNSGNNNNNSDGRYSLLQFALYNFREAIDKYSLESRANKSTASHTGDTSTLRGSLKLIETLRRSTAAAAVSSKAAANSSASRASDVITTKLEPDTSISGGSNANDWTWRELAQMVKFTTKPLKLSLLKLPSGDLNKRALDCFAAIMQYMGDLRDHHNASSKLNEVECVYLILMNCHNYPILRDEIYCQLMKQTTNNRSEQQDSCLRGWRLFSMIAAYFDCSELLRPYLLKYLETAAYDKRRAYCSVALICLQNLRKTLKYGGRKNVPSIEEIAATSAGRNSKRQIYRLPGGTERVINTKSSTVVDDIIYEICSSMLGVNDQDEMLEFSLYCIADGDLYTMPLNRDEYILDVTTELIKNHQQYFLIFCRSIWHYPLRLDSKLYIEVIFNQIAPDYLEGLLLVLPELQNQHRQQQQQQQQQQQHKPLRRLSSSSSFTSKSNNNNRQLIEQEQQQQTIDRQHIGSSQYQLRLKAKLVKDIARIAALLHRASGTDYMPHRDEVKYLLPKPIIAAMKQASSSSSSGSTTANQRSQRANSTTMSSMANNQSLHTSSSSSHLPLSEEQAASTGSNEPEASVQPPEELSPSTDTTAVVITPQKWTELVQENWREMSAFDTLDAKAQFLEIVRHWPLFGSSFFAIKLFQRDLMQPIELILALNKLGIQMLDLLTHEKIHRYSFNEVISTRKVRSEDGALFLDLKCGNLMKRTIIRIQTDQAHEISRLIRQYIDIELIQQKQQQQTSQQQATASLSSSGSDRARKRYQENPTISS